MWNRLRFIRFLQVSQIFQRRKSDTNKQDFENKLNLTCHAQSTPKTTGFLTKVFSTSGPNLVALAWTVDELSREQAQNGVNFDFEVKFDLEGQGQSPPKTIGILTKVFYTYGPNLVILAWTGDELSRGQTWWRTDWRTDGRTQATTIPEGQYWPRVKRCDRRTNGRTDGNKCSSSCLNIGDRIFPCRCISIKKKSACLWDPCWPIYLQTKPSLNCWIAAERTKFTFILILLTANQDSNHDDISTL